tara:strand:- start:375 stop:788 length:414 start_codon:yes stop_codon:yes gene_type:complete
MKKECLVSVKKKMIIQKAALDALLLDNVCEIRFARRIIKPGQAPTRRMLCTKSLSLLNSVNGRISLNYFPPKGPPKAYLGPDRLAVAWDIIMQDYRNINTLQCDLIQQIPANDDFWVYFNENIYPMSPGQKFNFMNS